MEAVKGTGAIPTKEEFADFQLHLEFATPAQVQGNRQGRGNSGVLINGMYEVQVLDSYNNPTCPDGQAGAIHGQTPPLGIREGAASSEPLGSLLALRLGLYEEDVRGVYAGGGLVGFQSVLASPFLYLPHDVVIPGALTAGDLSVLAAGLAHRPLALVGLVDGLNRAVDRKTAEAAYEQTSRAYQAANVRDRLVVAGAEDAPAPGPWLLETLK